ncbi:alpha/beta fold hydrolase [Rhodococcus sp. D2-41]|uniref:Alpha/beta fold hydrolase n=1 Tax=Speluncibacter jeojiensis TaxID=2710754 RepID=A0A9X4M0A1_9ACTN|nr:alpha/beta fold hydrolase [Rhodococcus sp. D2-41]MDG3009099.1 alpha/beta fold hydrolase [Rhodococcus sp. D2-41]MDG3015609.1 alpha/beta fold hydrolase [Corynebacteriales bacterium D3-21]
MITQKHLDLHGDQLAYRIGGDGEPLLFIHGMVGSSRAWRYVMPRLADRHLVLAPDLPGHGSSGKPRGDYSLGAFAAALRDMLDRLGIERVTVVGHSLGGGVAMQLAYQHPELCERLVLISSGGLGREVNWLLRLMAVPGSEAALAAMTSPAVRLCGGAVRDWLGSRGVRAERADESWRALMSLSGTESRRAFLRTLRSVVDPGGQAVSALDRLYLTAGLPVQVIWGAGDPIIPVDHAFAARDQLAGSKLSVLDGVGHFPHVEAPDTVAGLIDRFVSATPAGGQASVRHARGQLRTVVGEAALTAS